LDWIINNPLDHQQPEGTVKHPQGKYTLNPGNLVVVKLHRVDLTASVFIILGIWSKDTGQQNFRFISERVYSIRTHSSHLPQYLPVFF
jgi:hypothetical protein